MTTLKWFSIPFLLFLATGCAQQEEKKENSHQEEVFIDNSGLFRGYVLGSSPDSVLAAEKWAPAVANDSIIEYRVPVYFSEDTVLLKAYLAFDTYGLFEVQVDVFTMDDTLAETILDNWSAALSTAFGEHENLIAARRWTTFSESNNTVEITLSQERNDQSQKFISLNYLEPLDDEY
ncbi:MAG: hypothetical protein WBG42_06645 [Cryomorphaceae bacterium]